MTIKLLRSLAVIGLLGLLVACGDAEPEATGDRNKRKMGWRARTASKPPPGIECKRMDQSFFAMIESRKAARVRKQKQDEVGVRFGRLVGVVPIRLTRSMAWTGRR